MIPESPPLSLTPEGRLHAPAGPADDAGVLLRLVAESPERLTPAEIWFREFALNGIARLCHLPPEPDGLPGEWRPDAEALFGALLKAPPLPGGEYLNTVTLDALWGALQTRLRELMRGHTDGPRALLLALHPSLHAVGRVTFHLAENPASPERPFAFLATFVETLSADAKPRHLPLARALKLYAEAGDNAALLRLLAPVRTAAESSAVARRLLESRAIFAPQAWTPPEAFAFLREAPLLEAAGIALRMPDWWSGKNRARAGVKVSVGTGVAGGVHLGALLDFNYAVAVGDEALTAAEARALLAGGDGLVQFKGRWVEVDRARIEAALARWDALRRESPDGLSLLRAMRLLAGVSPDSPENLPDADAESGVSRVVPGDRLRETLATLRGETAGAPHTPIPGLLATLRPYQHDGVARLHFMQRLGLGACLADDMGLGKTVQVLALLRRLRNEESGTVARRPALLVAPASLLQNWHAEAAKFTPSLKLRLVHPAFATRGEPDPTLEPDAATLHDTDLIATTYSMVGRLDWLRTHTWRLLVLDEAQAIKTPGAARTRAVKTLRADARLALTGTPIENRLGDLWSLFDFAEPGLLGTGPQFTRYTKDLSDFAPLRRLVAPYILRRLKTDKRIIDDLPEKTEMPAWCALGAKQAALYRKLVDDLRAAMEAAAQAGDKSTQRRGLVLASIMRLKQVCNHPDQLAESGDFDAAHSGKFKRLADLAAEIASRGEKVIVFTQFREMTGPLERLLAGVFGARGLILHGATPVDERNELVNQFQDPHGPPFFVLTVKAGGTGLTLTAANHVIHFDRWWNPAVENQATDRAFRIGQKKAVMVHKLICRGTVEEKIDALIAGKTRLADDLLASTNEPALTELPDDELLALVALDLGSMLPVE